ncbi:MAG TPA: YeeE/YedE thiosulfate transporter family protein [Vicinamibacterales bacterium]|jgi:uncharacterized membrane protein YedE/YeeE
MPGSDVLLLHGLPPLHWAVAGAGLGVVTLALIAIGNRRLGISSGFEDVCSIVVNRPYFRRRALTQHRAWRLPFVVGLAVGGFVSAALGGGWSPTWALGTFDQVIGLGHLGKSAWMFAGGLLVGFGTRLANGCTSGHGIFGVANLELPSVVATAIFLASASVTTHVIDTLASALR